MLIDVEIVRALPDQAGQLTAIAFAAKRHWGYPERWIAQWRAMLTITPAFVAAHAVYVATSAAGGVGFYALAGAGPTVSLDHLWVLPQHIGSGLGRRLFEHALEQARQRGAAYVEIESDPNAEGFYRHLGARRIGEVVSAIDGQPRTLPLLLVTLAPLPT